LPLLIILCLTSIDFGRLAYAYIALGNAARVGAEVAATRSYSTSTAAARLQEMESAVREDFSTDGGLDPSLVSFAADVVSDAYGLHRFTITASYPFSTVVSWPGIPRPLDLQRTITYRRFR
jgi:Flp pilus assembly protein TadG